MIRRARAITGAAALRTYALNPPRGCIRRNRLRCYRSAWVPLARPQWATMSSPVTLDLLSTTGSSSSDYARVASGGLTAKSAAPLLLSCSAMRLGMCRKMAHTAAAMKQSNARP